MKKDHTPPEAISFVRLVELIVEQRHGSDAIAEITTHVVGKGKNRRTVLKRAGKPINPLKDGKDSNKWNSAKETIRQACNTGELTAYVRNKSDEKLKVSTGYWDALINIMGHDGATPIIPVSDSHWYTLDTGLFRTSTEPSYNDRPVYFEEDEATSFLDTLDGKAGIKKPGHSRSDPGELIQLAIQGLKDAGVKRKVVHYHPDVLELLPKKDLSVDRGTNKIEYAKKTGIALSTIKGFIREIYKT